MFAKTRRNLPMIEQKLYDYLNAQNIPFETFEHAPAFTCEQMTEIRAGLPDYFCDCKNLFLKDKKKRYYLITALFETKIELKKLAQEWNAPELRFARPDELEAILGVKPGSVTLFALINDTERKVTPVLDKNLFSFPRIGLHPLRNDMTTLVTPQDAEKFVCSLGYEFWTL